MGVASNRVDVKQAAARAERALERAAEPLGALFLPAERWPAARCSTSPGRDLIRNAAHDSVCACSHDDVGDAVLAPLRRSPAHRRRHHATGRSKALGAVRSPTPGALIVNPSARARGGIVEIDLPGEGPAEAVRRS